MIVCLGTTPALSRTMEFSSVTVDGVNRSKRVHEYASGKAINAARAIRTLGETVACIGTAGGATGDRLRAAAAEAMTEQDLATVRSPTRLCITVVDRAAQTSTELIEESGSLIADEGEAVLNLLSKRLPRASVCVLAGSLAPGLEPSFYARCIRACRAAGVRTILDASGPALAAAIAELPDFVKLNAGELATVEAIAGDGDAAIKTAAARLARRTGGWVIVTRGRSSTLAISASESFAVEVPEVKVVSPIGSGDSFAGGLAVGLSRGMPFEESLRLATACASANAMTPHAAHFDLHVVESLLPEVTVVRL